MVVGIDGVLLAAATTDHGLTAVEASARLCREGANELPQDGPRRLPRIVYDALREPMLQLLLAAGLLYLVLGDLAEALILLAFAVLNVALVVVQESRTERALAALRDLTSPQALVVRDGQRQRIPARDLVTGDIVIAAEGDRVPADAVLLETAHLEVDESLLTGESVPVGKAAGDPSGIDARPGGEGTPFIWSGTLVVRGSGIARVTATGARTQIGRIGTSLGTVDSAPTPLQLQTRQLIRWFAAAGIASSVLLAVVYGLLHGEWIEAALAGITLAMATLPEEFPLVLTIFLVLGARRLSDRRVLARRSAAVEALGAATVLCTDKTGTLTLNRMRVARLAVTGATLDLPAAAGTLPEPFHALAEFAILASRPDPFDPMERALHELGASALAQTEHLHPGWTIAHGYQIGADLLAMSNAYRSEDGTAHLIAAKGAPEAVGDLCHLPEPRMAAMRRDVAAMAADGLRVLGVARAVFRGLDWPAGQHAFDFAFLGLVGLADPLRPGVPEAVAACRAAGIRVAMITGDHPATALAIAAQAGIATAAVITGPDLTAMDDAALHARLRDCCVFARIMPEQKLRLVQALAAAGEVVAMTGDGVNDAPSLKAAHIGVAMGGRGTDVAREAAALVLQDDDFSSLVMAVRIGRRIDDNLRKAFAYILAVHVPIAGMSLLPTLFGWPLLLGPVHVVFLEMIIDPVSSIVFEAEPEEATVMARPPRDPRAPLIDRLLLVRGLAQGGVALAAALGVFLLGTTQAHGEAVARAMAFTTLVLSNLGLVLTNRSIGSSVFRAAFRPNRALGLVFSVMLPLLVLTLAVPWLRGLFQFAPLGWGQVAEAAGAALATVPVNDAIRAVLVRYARRAGARRGPVAMR